MKGHFHTIRTIPDDEWLRGLRRECEGDWRQVLPQLPDEMFQRRFVGKAYEDAMQQAFEAVEAFRLAIKSVGSDFRSDNYVIDFGCGWGRISQTLYRYFDPEKIISADIQLEALDYCRKSGLRTNLVQVIGEKIETIESSSVDVIVAYSVFSHLSEEKANKVIMEFLRVLKPGGSIAITTRTPAIIRHAMNLQQMDLSEIPVHARGIAEAFSDADKALHDYHNGRFVYRDLPALTKVGEGYGEALIPEGYVRKHWQPIFRGPFQFVQPSGSVDQAIIALNKAV